MCFEDKKTRLSQLMSLNQIKFQVLFKYIRRKDKCTLKESKESEVEDA